MIQGETLNPRLVHDAAAHLFWHLAEIVGVPGANERVVQTAGQCLFNKPFTKAILGQYEFEEQPPIVQQEFRNAIAAEAERFALNEENMDGVIYVEDAESCRAPSAKGINTASLKAIPKRVLNSGCFEILGRLCLRHPLPAVVFSDKQPEGEIIQVANTSIALGFQLPIFLSGIKCQQIEDELFVMRGIFYVPAPDAHRAKLWDRAMLNSIRFCSGINIITKEPVPSPAVTVEWP